MAFVTDGAPAKGSLKALRLSERSPKTAPASAAPEAGVGGFASPRRLQAASLAIVLVMPWACNGSSAGLPVDAALALPDALEPPPDAAPHAGWPIVIGGPCDDDGGAAVAIDRSGNVLVTGGVAPPAEALAACASADVFVALYDPAGAQQWFREYGTVAGHDFGIDIAVDAAGNAYVAGRFDHMIDFGGGTLLSDGIDPTDGFFARFSPDGGHVWSRRFGGPEKYDVGNAIVLAPDGTVVLAGEFTGAADIGGLSLTSGSSGAPDAFVAKLDPADGSAIWARRMGGTAHDLAHDVAIDGAGNVYVVGFFMESGDFGGEVLTSRGMADGFITALSPAGAFRWTRQVGGLMDDTAASVVADSRGNLVVAGEFHGDFGMPPMLAAGGADIFLVGLTPDGAQTWAKTIGNTDWDTPFGVALDGTGGAVLSGTFSGTLTVGPGTDLVSEGQEEILLISHDALLGTYRWARSFGGAHSDWSGGIGADGAGRVFVTGSFAIEATFGSATVASSGPVDAFIFRFPP